MITKTIIFGNGINDLLLKRKIIDINEYFNKEMIKKINIMKKDWRGLYDINEFVKYFINFNKIAYQKKWKFDTLYTKALEFRDFDNTWLVNLHIRLQDIIKSILNSWLIEEFDIYNKNATSIDLIQMINFFDNKITINYVIPEKINNNQVNFLHGSFYEEDGLRRHPIRTVKNNMAVDEWIENKDRFFQELPYVHLSNKYGLAEMKNMDNLIGYIGSIEEKQRLEEYEEIKLMNKSLGFKSLEARSLQKEDFSSYNDLIPKSDVIVIFGINPSCDEYLLEESFKKCSKLIFVWYTVEDKKRAIEVIENNKLILVWCEDFIKQYSLMNLLVDNFKNTK